MINVKREGIFIKHLWLIDFSWVRLSEIIPWWTLEKSQLKRSKSSSLITDRLSNWRKIELSSFVSRSIHRFTSLIHLLHRSLSWSDIIYLILISSCRLDHYPAEESQLAWTNRWPLLFHQKKRRTLSKTIIIIITSMRKAFLTWLCRCRRRCRRFCSFLFLSWRKIIDRKRMNMQRSFHLSRILIFLFAVRRSSPLF